MPSSIIKETFVMQSALKTRYATAQTRPYNCLKLVNCYANRELGRIIKRDGSLSESIGSVTNPLGMGIYEGQSSALLLPFQVSFLANFNGTAFKKKVSGAWSSVNLHANISSSLSSTKPTQWAQLGTVLAILGGKPARWDGSATQVEQIGYDAPGSAITFSTAAGSLSPTVGYQYMYTYFNSTTGKESDWSPLSSSTGAQTSKQFNLTIPTTVPNHTADKKRIYRTQDGGSVFYRLTEISIATGSYSDNNADSALGAQSPDQFTRAMPPTTCFVGTKYSNHFLLVDGSNPYKLYASQPYTGSDNDVEYYPVSSRLTCEHAMTALYVTTAGCLIFGSRQISILQGSSIADFAFRPLYRGIGTLFPSSVAANGRMIVFVSESGVSAIGDGGLQHLSGDIDDKLSELLSREYSNHVYVCAEWNPGINQFLFAFSLSTANETPWVFSSDGAKADWVLSSGTVAPWTLIGGTLGQQSTTRVQIWGYDPDEQQWHEHALGQISDLNSVLGAIKFLVTPPPSSSTYDPQQEKTYVGIDLGSGAGKIVGGWRSDYAQDDAVNVNSLVITGRIPLVGAEENSDGRNKGAFRRLKKIQFPGSYADPTVGGGVVKILPDFDDPHKRDYSAVAQTLVGSGDLKQVPRGRMRYYHLLVQDSGSSPGKVLLQEWSHHYVEKENLESR